MKYEPVIGIEVHAQLKTGSKLFCGCSTGFAAAPNHHVCPVCLGLPGTLPVLNRKAIEYVVRTCIALECEVSPASRFARKNYYYPDLPKAYQISQYELPIGRNGKLTVRAGGKEKTIRIHRIHLEEDAGKLVHDASGGSCVDYNRTGIPLMEIVTEADVRSSEEAVAYLTSLRSILQYIGVCGANMEKGEMRCEPNISVRPVGAEEFGTKTEMKNLNSFRAVRLGVDFEIERQIDAIENGERIVQETRRWDEATQTTQTMRSKERAHDYRYFPDPDLVPVEVSESVLERLRAKAPELPEPRRVRFISQYGLPEYDAEVLTGSKAIADFFERAASLHNDPKAVSNWIMTELMGCLNESGKTIDECAVTAEDLTALLGLMGKGVISARMGKDIFKDMFATGRPPAEIIKDKGLEQLNDETAISDAVEKVIADNPGPAADFRAGKKQAAGFLVGQVMRRTGGKANPKIVGRIIEEKLLSE
ncbi:MAG: Aspartyl/glutamyl-tRNA(Asn/Gln) amidotransferase subunit B [bacterium ADurb.Bin236]|nr:MAG: Aspartyl/glutamyl-tRNA(Asn/Gln) amidotransferase subunit B [bacterium ADurb.Bin236]HPN95944.1 Asp-tRNA(Asn)/Glu-tRNA(Gln) amidotransferase subunit GatB [bacterium]